MFVRAAFSRRPFWAQERTGNTTSCGPMESIKLACEESPALPLWARLMTPRVVAGPLKSRAGRPQLARRWPKAAAHNGSRQTKPNQTSGYSLARRPRPANAFRPASQIDEWSEMGRIFVPGCVGSGESRRRRRRNRDTRLFWRLRRWLVSL